MKNAKHRLSDELECLQSLLEIRELDSNPDYWDENETPTDRAKYRAELEARIETTKKHIETLEKVVELSKLTEQFGHSAN